MSRIFWDTNLFIYLFEDYGSLSEQVTRLRRSMIERGDQLLTSTLTLGEIMVKPYEQSQDELARKYQQAITAVAQVLAFDATAAGVYARLRCDRSIRAPDAIQLACASAASTDLFITNDAHLHKKHVEGIQFIASLDRAPL